MVLQFLTKEIAVDNPPKKEKKLNAALDFIFCKQKLTNLKLYLIKYAQINA